METKAVHPSQDSIVTERLRDIVAAEEAEAVAYKEELLRWLLAVKATG